MGLGGIPTDPRVTSFVLPRWKRVNFPPEEIKRFQQSIKDDYGIEMSLGDAEERYLQMMSLLWILGHDPDWGDPTASALDVGSTTVADPTAATHAFKPFMVLRTLTMRHIHKVADDVISFDSEHRGLTIGRNLWQQVRAQPVEAGRGYVERRQVSP